MYICGMIFNNINYQQLIVSKKINDSLDNLEFIDRVYFTIKENYPKLNYGLFISKVFKHSMRKVLKSLDLYVVKGARMNKKVYVHPDIYVVIELTLVDNIDVAKNIIKLVNGDYKSQNIMINDFTLFNNLSYDYKYKTYSKFNTYLIKNNKNGLVKIGRASDVIKRLAQLKHATGEKDLEIVGYLTKDIEGLLHVSYAQYRELGEWFNLNKHDVFDICMLYNFQYLTKKTQ